MQILIYILIALFISMALIAVMWQLAPHIGMIDKPDPRKVHSKPVARVGGIGIVIGALIPMGMFLPIDNLVQSYILGSIILLFFGALDDKYELGHYTKFIGQFAAVLLVVFHGDLYVQRVPFFSELPPVLGMAFTVVAMVGMINAINHSDGLDGLAGGEALLSLIVIALLALSRESMLAVTIAGATIGGILGFLRFNTHPAQVFMGDSGSQFIGFTLAFLAVYLTQQVDTVMSAALPILFLGLPIVDIIAVLFLRIKQGMNWFKATRNHIHHRLLDLGFDHYETVVIIYSIQTVLVISSLFLTYDWDYLIIAIYLSISVAVFAFLSLAERRGWRAHKAGEDSIIAKTLRRIKGHPLMQSVPVCLLSILVPLYLLAGSILVTTVPRDFGVMAVFLSGMLVVLLFLKGKETNYLQRGIIYAVAMFVVYLGIYYPPHVAESVSVLESLLFLFLLILIAISIRFSSNVPFKTTPMDYLVLFMVFIIGILSERYLQNHNITLVFVKGCLILYGSEIIVTTMKNKWNSLNLASLAALGILGIRGLLI